jgi:hypothetical protein
MRFVEPGEGLLGSARWCSRDLLPGSGRFNPGKERASAWLPVLLPADVVCVTKVQAYALQDNSALALELRELPALGIAAIQARLAAVQQDQRLGVALAAQHRAGGKGTGGIVWLWGGLA